MKLPSSVFETDASTSSATPAITERKTWQSIAGSDSSSIMQSLKINGLRKKSRQSQVSRYNIIRLPSSEIAMSKRILLTGFFFLLLPLIAYAQTTLMPPYLASLNNPDLVYLLLLLGIYGLFFEITNPGLFIPGVAGLLSLFLVLYVFMWMPVDFTALTLLFVGLVLIVYEAFVFSYGIAGFFGIIAFTFGSLSLFGMRNPTYHVSWYLILIMAAITLAFFFTLVRLAILSHKKAVITGQEGIIGKHGVVLKINSHLIKVRVLGEIWDATSSVSLQPDQPIQVTQINGLLLTVEPIDKTK